jgi:LPXTG-motif cell wall-anchored protein
MIGSGTTRRLLAAAAGLAIGLGGLAAAAVPAHAEIVSDPYQGESPIVVSDESTCGALDITLENTDDTASFKAVIETSAGHVEPVALDPGDIRIIGFQTEISYVVTVDGHLIAEGAWEDPGNCDPSQIPVDATFDCDSLTVVITNPRTFNQTIRITVVGGGLPDRVLDVEPGAVDAEFTFDAAEGTVATVTMGDTTLAVIPWVEPEDCDDEGPGNGSESDKPGDEQPETENAGSELPKTGTPMTLLIGASLGLLVAGGAMYLMARRRIDRNA